MTVLNADSAIQRFKENEERIDKFVNEVGFYVTNSGLGNVETLASFLIRKETELNSFGVVANGETLVTNEADLITANASGIVTSIVLISSYAMTQNFTLVKPFLIKPGCIITTTGFTFNTNKFLRIAGNFQIFAGSGSVTNILKATPFLFGAKANGINDDKAAVESAAYSVAPGGLLLIPSGVYHSSAGFTILRGDITVIGGGMPQVASNLYSLSGGTILKGQVLFSGDNINLANFGVDSGITYTDTHNSGNGCNGLVVHDGALTAILKNINVINVIGLIRIGDNTDIQAAFHGILLEGLQYGTADNIVGVGGWFGVVLKVSDFNCGNIYGRENDAASVIIKSETYAPVDRVNINNVITFNSIARGYYGFAVDASGFELKNVCVNNISAQGGHNSLQVTGEWIEPAYNITIGNLTSNGAANGIAVTGPVYALCIGTASIWQPSGTGFYTGVNANAINPKDVTINCLRVVPSATSPDSVNIGYPETKVLLGSVNTAASDGYTLVAGSGINISLKTTIGQYVGTLKISNTVPTLKNGWAAKYAQPVGIIAKSGITRGYGRISSAAATSDIFMTIPAGMAPNNLEFFASMTAYNGTTNIPVIVSVAANGDCSVYPNRAAYSSAIWFNLTDLSFLTEIPAEGGI